MKKRMIDFWRRQGSSGKRNILFTAFGSALLIIGISAVWTRSGAARADLAGNAPTTLVERGPLTINISESGTIRPREQIILKNELEGPATIIYVVEEGAMVKKGDLLVELDISQLEDTVIERRIRVQNEEADLIYSSENLAVVENQAEADIQQAELNYKFAQQDLERYAEGEFPKRVKEAEAKITLAEEELSRAEEELKWSRILFDEKYLSQSELQQDELAAKKAGLNLDLARTELELLMDYTYRRELDQLESDVQQAKLALDRTRRMASANLAKAKAQFAAREASFKEQSDRLERLESQLEKAKIFAPIDGMVLYASSVNDRWRRNDDTVEVGTVIREKEEILYLPTASEFNVDLKISEVDLNKVRLGLPVRITVDALPGRSFTGRVGWISHLPDSGSRWLNPNLKLYETTIEMDPNPAQLRNGMSCRAEIIVEHHEDVLFVPIQSVVRLNGKPATYVVESDGAARWRPVEIGLDNSRFLHILSGLEEGERVFLAPPLKPSQSGDGPFQEKVSPEEETALGGTQVPAPPAS
jgi:HlyD family secretion protein